MTAKRRAHSTTTYDAIERPYPRVLRTTVDADRDLRAYAAEYEIEPYEALVVAIDRLRDPVESEALRASLDAAGKLAERLAADLESAREATRRADAEIERVTADWRAALAETERVKALALERAGADATEIKRLTVEATVRAREYAAAAAKLGTETERLQRELAASQARERQADEGAMDARAEAAPCACALPDDLAPRLAAIAARRDVEPHVMLANVIKNGISKIEASDKYQDAQKAARARS